LSWNNNGETTSEDKYINPDDGSITEGDDHVWLGNLEMLEDGHWWAGHNMDQGPGDWDPLPAGS
jgi:hypothetical protein